MNGNEPTKEQIVQDIKESTEKIIQEQQPITGQAPELGAVRYFRDLIPIYNQALTQAGYTFDIRDVMSALDDPVKNIESVKKVTKELSGKDLTDSEALWSFVNTFPNAHSSNAFINTVQDRVFKKYNQNIYTPSVDGLPANHAIQYSYVVKKQYPNIQQNIIKSKIIDQKAINKSVEDIFNNLKKQSQILKDNLSKYKETLKAYKDTLDSIYKKDVNKLTDIDISKLKNDGDRSFSKDVLTIRNGVVKLLKDNDTKSKIFNKISEIETKIAKVEDIVNKMDKDPNSIKSYIRNTITRGIQQSEDTNKVNDYINQQIDDLFNIGDLGDVDKLLREKSDNVVKSANDLDLYVNWLTPRPPRPKLTVQNTNLGANLMSATTYISDTPKQEYEPESQSESISRLGLAVSHYRTMKLAEEKGISQDYLFNDKAKNKQGLTPYEILSKTIGKGVVQDIIRDVYTSDFSKQLIEEKYRLALSEEFLSKQSRTYLAKNFDDLNYLYETLYGQMNLLMAEAGNNRARTDLSTLRQIKEISNGLLLNLIDSVTFGLFESINEKMRLNRPIFLSDIDENAPVETERLVYDVSSALGMIGGMIIPGAAAGKLLAGAGSLISAARVANLANRLANTSRVFRVIGLPRLARGLEAAIEADAKLLWAKNSVTIEQNILKSSRAAQFATAADKEAFIVNLAKEGQLYKYLPKTAGGALTLSGAIGSRLSGVIPQNILTTYAGNVIHPVNLFMSWGEAYMQANENARIKKAEAMTNLLIAAGSLDKNKYLNLKGYHFTLDTDKGDIVKATKDVQDKLDKSRSADLWYNMVLLSLTNPWSYDSRLIKNSVYNKFRDNIIDKWRVLSPTRGKSAAGRISFFRTRNAVSGGIVSKSLHIDLPLWKNINIGRSFLKNELLRIPLEMLVETSQELLQDRGGRYIYDHSLNDEKIHDKLDLIWNGTKDSFIRKWEKEDTYTALVTLISSGLFSGMMSPLSYRSYKHNVKVLAAEEEALLNKLNKHLKGVGFIGVTNDGLIINPNVSKLNYYANRFVNRSLDKTMQDAKRGGLTTEKPAFTKEQGNIYMFLNTLEQIGLVDEFINQSLDASNSNKAQLEKINTLDDLLEFIDTLSENKKGSVEEIHNVKKDLIERYKERTGVEDDVIAEKQLLDEMKQNLSKQFDRHNEVLQNYKSNKDTIKKKARDLFNAINKEDAISQIANEEITDERSKEMDGHYQSFLEVVNSVSDDKVTNELDNVLENSKLDTENDKKETKNKIKNILKEAIKDKDVSSLGNEFIDNLFDVLAERFVNDYLSYKQKMSKSDATETDKKESKKSKKIKELIRKTIKSNIFGISGKDLMDLYKVFDDRNKQNPNEANDKNLRTVKNILYPNIKNMVDNQVEKLENLIFYLDLNTQLNENELKQQIERVRAWFKNMFNEEFETANLASIRDRLMGVIETNGDKYYTILDEIYKSLTDESKKDAQVEMDLDMIFMELLNIEGVKDRLIEGLDKLEISDEEKQKVKTFLSNIKEGDTIKPDSISPAIRRGLTFILLNTIQNKIATNIENYNNEKYNDLEEYDFVDYVVFKTLINGRWNSVKMKDLSDALRNVITAYSSVNFILRLELINKAKFDTYRMWDLGQIVELDKEIKDIKSKITEAFKNLSEEEQSLRLNYIRAIIYYVNQIKDIINRTNVNDLKEEELKTNYEFLKNTLYDLLRHVNRYENEIQRIEGLKISDEIHNEFSFIKQSIINIIDEMEKVDDVDANVINKVHEFIKATNVADMVISYISALATLDYYERYGLSDDTGGDLFLYNYFVNKKLYFLEMTDLSHFLDLKSANAIKDVLSIINDDYYHWEVNMLKNWLLSENGIEGLMLKDIEEYVNVPYQTKSLNIKYDIVNDKIIVTETDKNGNSNVKEIPLSDKGEKAVKGNHKEELDLLPVTDKKEVIKPIGELLEERATIDETGIADIEIVLQRYEYNRQAFLTNPNLETLDNLINSANVLIKLLGKDNYIYNDLESMANIPYNQIIKAITDLELYIEKNKENSSKYNVMLNKLNRLKQLANSIKLRVQVNPNQYNEKPIYVNISNIKIKEVVELEKKVNSLVEEYNKEQERRIEEEKKKKELKQGKDIKTRKVKEKVVRKSKSKGKKAVKEETKSKPQEQVTKPVVEQEPTPVEAITPTPPAIEEPTIEEKVSEKPTEETKIIPSETETKQFEMQTIIEEQTTKEETIKEVEQEKVSEDTNIIKIDFNDPIIEEYMSIKLQFGNNIDDIKNDLTRFAYLLNVLIKEGLNDRTNSIIKELYDINNKYNFIKSSILPYLIRRGVIASSIDKEVCKNILNKYSKTFGTFANQLLIKFKKC